jgi:signal transduction histidine kinase
MFERWSLRLPITLGVTMILIIIALIVGWIAVTTGALGRLSWTLLSVGTTFLGIVLAGVITYLTLSIKAINLSRRQSNFIDSVTHELKSPIASLKLYLQTMDKREVNDEERATFHRYMMDDVERLDNLISHLLDAGAVTKGEEPDSIERIRLHDLIEQCADSVCDRYRVDRNAVQLDLAACSIEGNRVDAVMIFRNLLDNAVKYAGSPPKVTANLRIEGERAVAEISDNGPGIPREMRRKIFGRFVRLGEELQRKKPGTGLGLFIVRTLVKRLGGKVRVLDRDRKMGTVFEVRLPATRLPNEESIVRASESSPEHSAGSNMNARVN